jgi:hypothetical protein
MQLRMNTPLISKSRRLRVFAVGMVIAGFFLSPAAPAYSVFTHEELIDLAWSSSIRPLLLARFPAATDEQLREAHAYAYGGCAIQDMGYYPFAKEFFSDLTHYVRSGDFISNLLRDAGNLDEYAFAIGALSHYLGDSIGHSEAVNLSTPIAFPKLEREFGPSVAYDQDPHAHIRTEFAFDIGQLSKRTFAPPSYMRHIGFRISRRLLDRAFRETYRSAATELPPAPLSRRLLERRLSCTVVNSFPIPRATPTSYLLSGSSAPTTNVIGSWAIPVQGSDRTCSRSS